MFLDIGIGILVSIFTAFTFGVDLTPWLVVAGVVFALLPDLDFVRYFFLKDKMEGYKHRDTFHLPLLYLPVGSLVLYLLGGELWAVLFCLGGFSHFIHDSFGIGRGVKWLYPISNSGFAFIYMYSRNKKGLWGLLFIFDETAIKKFDRDHGDPGWFKNVYLDWHPLAIFEFTFFLISLIILYLYVR